MKVFDASAVLALLFDEPGADLAARWLEEDDALISSVKQAEVLAKLLDKGLSEADIHAISQQLPLQVGCRSAPSRPAAPPACGRPRGRWACRRATAAAWRWRSRCRTRNRAPRVVTADRPWASLAGFDIALIR